MDIKEFIENFAAQFDDTDASVFTPETVFHELDEYSSLIALSIIAMVDEEYDVTLKGDDIIVSGIYAQGGEEYTKSIDALCEDDVFWLFDGAYDAAPWKCKELHKSEE